MGKEFNAGYTCAIAHIVYSNGTSTLAEEALVANGMKMNIVIKSF